jgi:hypothetical protein
MPNLPGSTATMPPPTPPLAGSSNTNKLNSRGT